MTFFCKFYFLIRLIHFHFSFLQCSCGNNSLKFNMHLLNYPHVDAALTSYISLHPCAPFSSSPVSPHFPRSPWCRWCKYAAMYIRAKNRASTATITCYPCFVPAVAHVRYDKLAS